MTPLNDLLRRADMAMIQGEWEKAEPLYQEVRALNPGNQSAEMGLRNVAELAKKAAEIEKRMVVADALFAAGDYRHAELEYIGIIDFAVHSPKILRFHPVLEQKHTQAKSLRTWQERTQKALEDAQHLCDQENWEAAAKLIEEIRRQVPQDTLYQPLRDRLAQICNEILSQEDQRTLMSRALELLRAKDYEAGITLLESILPDSTAYPQAQRFLNQARSYQTAQKHDLSTVEIALGESRWADALSMLEQWRGRYQDTSFWQQLYLQAGIAYGRTLLDHARQLEKQHDFDAARHQFKNARATFDKVLELYPTHIDAQALRNECGDLAEIAALQTQAQVEWTNGNRAEAVQALTQAQQRLVFASSEGRDYTAVSAVVDTTLGALQDEIERINEEARRLHDAEKQLAENHLNEAQDLFMATLDARLPEHQQKAAEGLSRVNTKIRQFKALMARGGATEDPVIAVEVYQDAYDLWPEGPDVSLVLEYALVKACNHALEAGHLAEAAGYGNRALILNPDNHEASSYVAKIGVKPQVEATLQRVRNEWAALQRKETREPTALEPLVQDLENVLRKVAEWPDLRTDLEALHKTLREAHSCWQQYTQLYHRAVQQRNRGAWPEAVSTLEQAVAALGDLLPGTIAQQLNVWRKTAVATTRAQDEGKTALEKAHALYTNVAKDGDLSTIAEAMEKTQHYLEPAHKLLRHAARQVALSDGLLPEEMNVLQKQVDDLSERIKFALAAVEAISISDGLLKLQEFSRMRGSDYTLEAIQAHLLERARESIGVIKQQAQMALQAGNLEEAEEHLRQIRLLVPTDVENARLYAEIHQRRILEEKLHAIEREAEESLKSGSPAEAMRIWRRGLDIMLEPNIALSKQAHTILNALLALGDRDAGMALGQAAHWKAAQERLTALTRLRQENWVGGRALFFAEQWLRLARDNALCGIMASAAQLGDLLGAYRAATAYLEAHPNDPVALQQAVQQKTDLLMRANETARKRIQRARDALARGDYEYASQNLYAIETDLYRPITHEFPDILESDAYTCQMREQTQDLQAEVARQRVLHAEVEPHLEAARQAYLDNAWAKAEQALNRLPSLQGVPDLAEQVETLRRQIAQARTDGVRHQLHDVMNRVETGIHLATEPKQLKDYLQELERLTGQPNFQMLNEEEHSRYTQLKTHVDELYKSLVEAELWEKRFEVCLKQQRYRDALNAMDRAIELTRKVTSHVELSLRRDEIARLVQTQQEREDALKAAIDLFDAGQYLQAQQAFDKAQNLGANTEKWVTATRAGVLLQHARRLWEEEKDTNNALLDLDELQRFVQGNDYATSIADEAYHLYHHIEATRQEALEAQRTYAKIQDLLASGQFNAALTSVQRILERNPTSKEALALQTQIYEQRTIQDLLEKARAAQLNGQYKDALQLAETVLQKQIDNPESLLLRRELEAIINADEAFLQVETLAKQSRFKEARELLIQVSREDVNPEKLRQAQQLVDNLEKDQWSRIIYPIQDLYRDGKYVEALDSCKQASDHTTAHELLDELKTLQSLIINRWAEKQILDGRNQLQKTLKQEQLLELETRLKSFLRLDPPPETRQIQQFEDLLHKARTRRLRMNLNQAQEQYEKWLADGIRKTPQSTLEIIETIQDEAEALGTLVDFDIVLDAQSLNDKIKEVLNKQDTDVPCTEYNRILTEAKNLRARWDNQNYPYDHASDADLEKIYELANRVLKTVGYENDAQARALIDWVVQERSPYTHVWRFFSKGGFTISKIAEHIYRCVPTSNDLRRLLGDRAYTRISFDETLGSAQILAIRDEVINLDENAKVVFIVTNLRPTDQGWAQIGTLRIGGEFTIIPLEQENIHRQALQEKEKEFVRNEVRKRLGTDYDPYDIRDPVAGAFSFFGRDMETKNLLRRVYAGEPVGIFGLRKLGKSSLLRALCDHTSFPVALKDSQLIGRSRLDEVYLRILRDWQQWIRIHWDLDYELPKMDSENATRVFTNTVLEWLERIEGARIGEPRLGLFLDEAEVLVPNWQLQRSRSARLRKQDLNRYLELMRLLRGLVDEGRLSLIFASLNPSINRINSFEGQQNPFHNRLQEIFLAPLMREDCMQMMRNIGGQVGLTYDDASVELISDYSGGHPFLARQFCSLIYKQREYQPGEIKQDIIPTIVKNFIQDNRTVAHLDEGIWQTAGAVELWGKEQAQVNQHILLDLARADEPLPEGIVLEGPSADERQTALIDLERFHFIHQPETGYYTIRYGLLHTWLRRRKLMLE